MNLQQNTYYKYYDLSLIRSYIMESLAIGRVFQFSVLEYTNVFTRSVILRVVSIFPWDTCFDTLSQGLTLSHSKFEISEGVFLVHPFPEVSISG